MNSKGRGLRAIILTGALALGLALASLALWGASAAPQTGTAASIYCVNGTGTACDASLDGCFATIQPAIDAASSGDQLLIAGGIYTEPGGTVVAIAGKGLNIDGGYNPSCSQHDPDQYQTVLDGQALGTVVSVTNTGAAAIYITERPMPARMRTTDGRHRRSNRQCFFASWGSPAFADRMVFAAD